MKKKLSQTANEWLPVFLKLYPPKTTAVVEEISEWMGYTKDELERAKNECGVKIDSDGIWHLPEVKYAGKTD